MSATDMPLPTPAAAELALTAHTSSAAVLAARAGWRQLEVLPIGLFAAVMGLAGLSVAWRLAAVRYGAPPVIAEATGDTAIAVFVLIALGYGVKLAIAPGAVRAEFNHPIAGTLFGTVPISLLLLAIVLAPLSLGLARGVWAVGAAGMAGFAWLIVSRWMGDRQMAVHATPAWIVPVVSGCWTCRWRCRRWACRCTGSWSPAWRSGCSSPCRCSP